VSRASAAPSVWGPELLHVEVVTTAQHLNRLGVHWRELYERANCRLPFLHWRWIETWWKTFGVSGRFVRNELLVLAVKDQTRLVSVLPFFTTTYGLGRSGSFRYVRPLGSDPNITEIHAALTVPGMEEASLLAAAEHFAGQAASWDLLNWNAFEETAARVPELPGLLCSTPRRPKTEMFLLRLPHTWEEFAAPLTRNTKEAIRKAHNAMKRDGVDPEFEVFSSSSEILNLLPLFFDLHRRRAHVGRAVRHPDVFRKVRHQDFLRSVIETMGEEDIVRLFVLKIRGRIVAMRLAFVMKDTLYLYYSGFEPEFGRYSVMTRLVVEIIKWSIQNGLSMINLSSGRDRSKTRWNPEVIRYRSYSHVARRWRSKAALAAIRGTLAYKRDVSEDEEDDSESP